MGFTDKFRQQHQDILTVVGTLNEKLKADADAQILRLLLSNLAGKLRFHLAMEDKALYPRMMNQGTETSAVAARFMEEMGGLAAAFEAYNSKWQITAIREDPAGFAAETHQVFQALGKRIGRENSELYPLADSVI